MTEEEMRKIERGDVLFVQGDSYQGQGLVILKWNEKPRGEEMYGMSSEHGRPYPQLVFVPRGKPHRAIHYDRGDAGKIYGVIGKAGMVEKALYLEHCEIKLSRDNQPFFPSKDDEGDEEEYDYEDEEVLR